MSLCALALSACSQATPTPTSAPMATPTPTPLPTSTPDTTSHPAAASYDEYAAWICDYRDAFSLARTWQEFAEDQRDLVALIRSITPPSQFSEYHAHLELDSEGSIRFAEEQVPGDEFDVQAWLDHRELNPAEYGGLDYGQPPEVDDLYEACWCKEFADLPELQPQGEMPFEEGSMMARAYERAQYCRGVPTPTPTPSPTPPPADRPLTVDEYLAWVCQEPLDFPTTWDGFVEFWPHYLAVVEAITPPPELREYHDWNIEYVKLTIRYTQERVTEGTFAEEAQRWMDYLEENREMFDGPNLEQSVGWETLEAHPVCGSRYQSSSE